MLNLRKIIKAFMVVGLGLPQIASAGVSVGDPVLPRYVVDSINHKWWNEPGEESEPYGTDGQPSVWEGGTNLFDPTAAGLKPAQRAAYYQSYARTRETESSAEEMLSRCACKTVPVVVDQVAAGALTLVSEACQSPLIGRTVWSWPVDTPWPEEFEVWPTYYSPPEGPLESWAFPNLPLDLDESAPRLSEIELLPGDRLYQVERIDDDGSAEVVAWFWFQAGESWNMVAFADASLGDPYLTIGAAEVLRFTAIEAEDLPILTWVDQSGDW